MQDRPVRPTQVNVDVVEQDIVDREYASMHVGIAIEQAYVEPVRAIDEAESGIAAWQWLECIRIDQTKFVFSRSVRPGVGGETCIRGQGGFRIPRQQQDRLDGRRRCTGHKHCQCGEGCPE